MNSKRRKYDEEIYSTIVSTFVESYDFFRKTIIPFCTSGSDSKDTIMEWVKSLGLDFGK